MHLIRDRYIADEGLVPLRIACQGFYPETFYELSVLVPGAPFDAAFDVAVQDLELFLDIVLIYRERDIVERLPGLLGRVGQQAGAL